MDTLEGLWAIFTLAEHRGLLHLLPGVSQTWIWICKDIFVFVGAETEKKGGV